MDRGDEGLALKGFFSQHPRACRWLSPFLLACSVYFLLWTPELRPSWAAALLKGLPVLCLVLLLGAVPALRGHARLLQGTLLCSAVGDTCLVWPETFLHGVAAFAAAHHLYLRAFGLSPLWLGLLLLALLAAATYLSVLLPHLQPAMARPMAAYALLLAAVLWRGLARGGSASLGALLFAVSDAVLAWDAFVQPLPHSHLVTMATYYAVQALITLSVLRSPEAQGRAGSTEGRTKSPSCRDLT
ncbi:lysoplasmalogenase [Heterocephalus glaber]|uniref:Lysoplasmalogenase TMEM86B n=1 Tax=Heterocephalus glaber TaxID=10181 RepID=A0AAX6Q886_HETGA|nr:lysoplasmalogenase [Heterocephalus glaber]